MNNITNVVSHNNGLSLLNNNDNCYRVEIVKGCSDKENQLKKVVDAKQEVYLTTPLFARAFIAVAEESRQKKEVEEKDKLDQVEKHSKILKGVLSDLYVVHKLNSIKEDYKEALYKGIVKMIKDWIWRKSALDQRPAPLYISSEIISWRQTETIEDKCAKIMERSINKICTYVKEQVHKHHLSERGDSEPQRTARLDFEWLADRHGYLAPEFIQEFINVIAEITQDLVKKRKEERNIDC